MDDRYLLELSNAERVSVMRALGKCHKAGANGIGHLIDDLKTMLPAHGIVIETSADVCPSDFAVYTSLQMPIEIVLVRQTGNDHETGVLEQRRDPERIAAIINSIRVNKALRGLLPLLDRLRDTIAAACESSCPDISAIMGQLHDYQDQYNGAVKEMEAL